MENEHVGSDRYSPWVDAVARPGRRMKGLEVGGSRGVHIEELG